MARKRKPASELTDKQLVKRLFSADTRKALKKKVLELGEGTPHTRKNKKR
jgi:hypothetical protein